MNLPHENEEQDFAKMRHDVRNILSTALLAADSLASNADSNVQRQAQTIIAAIELATDRLRKK
ncbi:hypothetical protein [Kozakia baliensis]|uniref:hypothetical protein n=1 Tax=Kozakia baliensis TaxID=153496 RepID=UPI0004953F96|nr:hypothetical protein [Kozakia baliensis]AOX19285.1 hypothetical protein A0U90_02120 [Kozakia baliensis]